MPAPARRVPVFAFVLMAAAGLAGCETTGGPSPQAAAAPVTRQQAALDCWMATEKDAARLGLDKRADLVTKCIADVMDGKRVPVAESAPAVAARPAPGVKPVASAKPKG